MNDMVNHPPHYTQGEVRNYRSSRRQTSKRSASVYRNAIHHAFAAQGYRASGFGKGAVVFAAQDFQAEGEVISLAQMRDKTFGSLRFVVKHEDFYNKKLGKPYEAIDKHNETYAAEYQDAEQNDCSLTWRMNTYAEFNSIERKMYKSFERYAKRG